MKNKQFQSEKEMAEKVVQYLRDNNFSVYQEVDARPISGIIDIVCTDSSWIRRSS